VPSGLRANYVRHDGNAMARIDAQTTKGSDAILSIHRGINAEQLDSLPTQPAPCGPRRLKRVRLLRSTVPDFAMNGTLALDKGSIPVRDDDGTDCAMKPAFGGMIDLPLIRTVDVSAKLLSEIRRRKDIHVHKERNSYVSSTGPPQVVSFAGVAKANASSGARESRNRARQVTLQS